MARGQSVVFSGIIGYLAISYRQPPQNFVAKKQADRAVDWIMVV